MYRSYLILIFCLIKCALCQIGPPIIQEIQRIRINAYRVKWTVVNELSYTLTRNRILLFDGVRSIEWPSQAVRVNKDGDDALELERQVVTSYLDCIKLCIANPQCRFIVRSGKFCYLKASTPTNSICGPVDECATVLNYSNEANLYDLPMNTTFRLQVQVYDIKTKAWSAPSQLSEIFSTNNIQPKISKIEKPTANTVRIKWDIVEEEIINPVRYKVSFFRTSFADIKEWPAQMTLANTDGSATEYNRFPADTKNSLECTNACLRETRCLLAVRDSSYCYLKDFPLTPSSCGTFNGCWVLKGYQSYADLINIPFDDIYKFQVSVYDQYSQSWTFQSDLSEDYDMKINLVVSYKKINDFVYHLIIAQDKNVYPIVRYRVLISKNDSAIGYDAKTEGSLKQYAISTLEMTFNEADATNQGRLSESACMQFCTEDYKCTGYMIVDDNNCFTTTSFNPFTANVCSINKRCMSISNNASEIIMDNLDASTNYKIQLEYITKYNTRGFSNLVEFNTKQFIIEINGTNLVQYNPASLKCNSLNDSLITQITWKRNDVNIESNNNLGIFIEELGRTLKFLNLSHVIHNGRYKCSAKIITNNQIIESNPYDLMVKYGPIFNDLYSNNPRFTFNISDSNSFFCSVEGYGPFKFGWVYNNDPSRNLESTNTFKNDTFIYNSTLKLNSMERKDNGSYSCLVDSIVVSTVYVFIPSKPSKPRLFTAKYINDTTIYMNWRVDDDGDYPITAVSVQSRDASGIINEVEKSITIGSNFNGSLLDLKFSDGTLLQIKVKNALGYSTPSDAFKYSVPASPEKTIPPLTLILAITIPLIVILAVAIILIIWYLRKKGKITRI